MTVRTEAVDRLLEALSPTLSAELERVVRETQETLERDFERRLDSAVREAQAAVQRASEAELQKAVAETRDSVRDRVTAELEQRFKYMLEESNNQLRRGFDQDIAELKRETAAERAQLQTQLHQWRLFAEIQQQLADAASQAEILVRLLKTAEHFSGSVAVYVAKADGLALWKNRGKSVFPEVISEDTTDPDFFFRRIMVRGRTVAAVCAAQPYNVEALQFLIAVVERAIEIFGLKLRAPAPKPPAITATPAVTPTPAITATPVMPETEVAVAPPQEEPAEAVPAGAGGDDQKLHADARRAARLLISEIKLYHEQALKEGRENHDIYQRLQKEIEQSRELYRQQVPIAVLASRDYFHEELVRILTEDEPSRLGDAYPGPMNA